MSILALILKQAQTVRAVNIAHFQMHLPDFYRQTGVSLQVSSLFNASKLATFSSSPHLFKNVNVLCESVLYRETAKKLRVFCDADA
jgi:hypothetical protein